MRVKASRMIRAFIIRGILAFLIIIFGKTPNALGSPDAYSAGRAYIMSVIGPGAAMASISIIDAGADLRTLGEERLRGQMEQIAREEMQRPQEETRGEKTHAVAKRSASSIRLRLEKVLHPVSVILTEKELNGVFGRYLHREISARSKGRR